MAREKEYRFISDGPGGLSAAYSHFEYGKEQLGLSFTLATSFSGKNKQLIKNCFLSLSEAIWVSELKNRFAYITDLESRLFLTELSAPMAVIFHIKVAFSVGAEYSPRSLWALYSYNLRKGLIIRNEVENVTFIDELKT
jgi:hypothetical protein